MATTEIDKTTLSRQQIVEEAKRRIMEQEDQADAEFVRKRVLDRLAEMKTPKSPK